MRSGRAVTLLALSIVGASCSSERLSAVNSRCPRDAVGEVHVSGSGGQQLLSAIDWYPLKALDLGWGGSAQIRCDVIRGKAVDCSLVREEPAGLNFGAVAMREAKKLDPPPGSDGAGVILSYRWTLIDRGCRLDHPTDQGLTTIFPGKPVQP